MLHKYINILHKNINILHKELCEKLGENNLHKTKVIFHYRLIIFLLYLCHRMKLKVYKGG